MHPKICEFNLDIGEFILGTDKPHIQVMGHPNEYAHVLPITYIACSVLLVGFPGFRLDISKTFRALYGHIFCGYLSLRPGLGNIQ